VFGGDNSDSPLRGLVAFLIFHCHLVSHLLELSASIFNLFLSRADLYSRNPSPSSF